MTESKIVYVVVLGKPGETTIIDIYDDMIGATRETQNNKAYDIIKWEVK